MASSTFKAHERQGAENLDKAKEAGGEALNKAKEAGKDAMGAVREVGAEALDKAKDMGADFVGKAKDAASAVGEGAANAATAVGHKANDLTAAAGHEIRGLGDSLATKGPQDGMAGAASHAVAEGIRGTGRYLEEAKLSGMAQDVEQVIKNHPIPALLLCLGIGFCLGRVMKD